MKIAETQSWDELVAIFDQIDQEKTSNDELARTNKAAMERMIHFIRTQPEYQGSFYHQSLANQLEQMIQMPRYENVSTEGV